MAPVLRVFDDITALSDAAADEVAAQAERSVAARGGFALVLSGGNTPRALYARLAQRLALPWAQTELWFGDERAVPASDPASNAGMVQATLGAQLSIPGANLQRIRGELPPGEAAAEYEQRLRARFIADGAGPRFDMVLLGLGADGHTASLFPRAHTLRERRAWVVADSAPPAPPARVTLTFPALNGARAVLFLVSGADKAEALRRVLAEQGEINEVPARGIAPSGTLTFFVDRAAASALPELRATAAGCDR